MSLELGSAKDGETKCLGKTVIPAWKVKCSTADTKAMMSARPVIGRRSAVDFHLDLHLKQPS